MDTDWTEDEVRVNGGAAPLPAVPAQPNRSAAASPARVTPLPPGTRLLHIGPHKTGTTAVQGALFAARDRLPEHGVVFPADSRHPMGAVLAACARPGMMGDARPRAEQWTRLLDQVRASGARTSVVSSEFFADAEDDGTVARVIEELGGRERVHVLVTLRPLAKIMPSQWQQYVQNGLRMGYEDWLEHMLRKPPYDKPNPSFWRRHRHDRLVERWVRALGAERVTVVVVDDRDRDGLMRTFEGLLGLPEHVLRPAVDTANRSLSLAETEMLRHLNVEFRAHGLPEQLYSRLIRYGAVMHMKNVYAPTPEDVKIFTPRWAVEAAAGIGAEMAERIKGTGVRVVGDVALLSEVPEQRAERRPEGAARLAPEAAAHALYGALAAVVATPPPKPVAPPRQAPRPRTVHQTPTKELVRVVGHRCLKRLRLR
ncbi:hypothetical protein [Streptomyces flavalbus]|uniref:Sulfotransferase family protein n=1 Tax=Streptomyces flavalbus TaxID=2665155 RepID=A0ABW2W8C0_9ACTN